MSFVKRRVSFQAKDCERLFIQPDNSGQICQEENSS